MSTKQNNWIIFLYLLIAFLLGISVAINFLPSRKSAVTNEQLSKLSEVLNYVDQYYVDSVDVDSLYDQTISYILQSLDPHSAYATFEENKTMMESLHGAFEGVGIQFNIMNDTVMVVATISGGPSEKAGIQAGDRLIAVDGKSMIGATNEKVFKTLRGQKGSKVKISIRRQGVRKTLHYEVVRDVIPTHTVDVAYMVNDQTGYIKLNEFGSTTAEEFHNAIEKLKSQGMKDMIVDLRGNAGGFLDAAISVCDELLPNKRQIVSIEGLHMRPERISATRKGLFQEGKVAILIDDFSASASEIVAGAVQDNDRGYIVGRRSFGKGLVQKQFDLKDKSSIRLTTARYHTPSGRCIQRDYKQGVNAYYEEMYERLAHGEMVCEDSIKLDKSLAYKTINGRTVYGGGGIMPDYFVPIDRGNELDGYYTIANSAAIVQFAFHYTNAHKNELKQSYPDVKSFISKMTVSDAMIQQLLADYAKLTKEKAPILNAASKKELKLWVKGLIGRNLYGNDGFYPIVNSTDPTLLKALSVLKKGEKLSSRD